MVPNLGWLKFPIQKKWSLGESLFVFKWIWMVYFLDFQGWLIWTSSYVKNHKNLMKKLSLHHGSGKWHVSKISFLSFRLIFHWTSLVMGERAKWKVIYHAVQEKPMFHMTKLKLFTRVVDLWFFDVFYVLTRKTPAVAAGDTSAMALVDAVPMPKVKILRTSRWDDWIMVRSWQLLLVVWGLNTVY